MIIIIIIIIMMMIMIMCMICVYIYIYMYQHIYIYIYTHTHTLQALCTACFVRGNLVVWRDAYGYGQSCNSGIRGTV